MEVAHRVGILRVTTALSKGKYPNSWEKPPTRNASRKRCSNEANRRENGQEKDLQELKRTLRSDLFRHRHLCLVVSLVALPSPLLLNTQIPQVR